MTLASKENREAVAVTGGEGCGLQASCRRSFAVSAISKAAPDLAPAVSAAAAEISSEQAVTIARAASFQAPAQAVQRDFSQSVASCSFTGAGSSLLIWQARQASARKRWLVFAVRLPPRIMEPPRRARRRLIIPILFQPIHRAGLSGASSASYGTPSLS